jgi:hypothetical protein
MPRTGSRRWHMRRPQRGRQAEAVGFERSCRRSCPAQVYNFEGRRSFQPQRIGKMAASCDFRRAGRWQAKILSLLSC